MSASQVDLAKFQPLPFLSSVLFLWPQSIQHDIPLSLDNLILGDGSIVGNGIGTWYGLCIHQNRCCGTTRPDKVKERGSTVSGEQKEARGGGENVTTNSLTPQSRQLTYILVDLMLSLMIRKRIDS